MNLMIGTIRSVLNSVVARAALAVCIGFVILAMVGCDGGLPFAPTPTQKLERGLGELTGAEVARQVAPAWEDMLRNAKEVEAAGAAKDFERIHKAYQATHAALKRAVDDTIQRLESAPDQSWRKKLLAELTVGGDTEAESKEYVRDLFPEPSYGSDDPDFESWLTRMAIEHPRESGEIARLAVEMKYDSMRLGLFFSTAIGSEAMKTIGEAYEGFRDGGRSAEK